MPLSFLNRTLRRWLLALAALALVLPGVALAQQATSAGPKVLVVYDRPAGTAYDKIGLAYGIMLRNLLGHFNASVHLEPSGSYVAGEINNYDVTFYLGAVYDQPLPAAFLSDASTTTKTLVWFKYNLWQLAWNSTYNFQATRGIAFSGLRGMNAQPSSSNPAPGFFDTVKYKNLDFIKYYTYDAANNVVNADPDVGVTSVTDATKASVVVPVVNPKTGESVPYVVRSGNFWYVADMPFSFIGPRDRYLVIADLLHDMVNRPHAEVHYAMVRLEDVGAMVSVQTMKTLSDYLYSNKIPFSIATIPYYTDPLGVYNSGVPQNVPLSQASNLKKALNYALARGGEIVMHGYTHQYAQLRNPYTAVSGDDYEFWNYVANSPVAEDSADWVSGRLSAGLADLQNNGYSTSIWETPHYQASAITSRTVPQFFSKTYQRVVYYTADKPAFNKATGKDYAVGQVFPYVVHRDYYTQKVLPENLGNLEYDSTVTYTADDIITNAKYAKAVRDGFASWFFHPFLLEPDSGAPGYADFQKAMTGITQLGYTWIAPSKLP